MVEQRLLTAEGRSGLQEGDILIGSYPRGVEHRVRVGATEEGSFKYDLLNDEGEVVKSFKSPSMAGSHIMGGTACNGWRFFRPEDEHEAVKKERAERPAKAVKEKKEGIASGRGGRSKQARLENHVEGLRKLGYLVTLTKIEEAAEGRAADATEAESGTTEDWANFDEPKPNGLHGLTKAERKRAAKATAERAAESVDETAEEAEAVEV